MADDETISISFGRDEALVLFELAIRLKKPADLLPGEREVLDLVECALEKRLAEPFLPNYAELLRLARSRVAIQESD